MAYPRHRTAGGTDADLLVDDPRDGSQLVERVQHGEQLLGGRLLEPLQLAARLRRRRPGPGQVEVTPGQTRMTSRMRLLNITVTRSLPVS